MKRPYTVRFLPLVGSASREAREAAPKQTPTLPSNLRTPAPERTPRGLEGHPETRAGYPFTSGGKRVTAIPPLRMITRSPDWAFRTFGPSTVIRLR